MKSDEAFNFPPVARRIPLVNVPAYLVERHDKHVSLQTVYNWIDRGVKGEKLRVILAQSTSKYASALTGVRFTTATWIEDFLDRVKAKAGIR